MERQERCEYCTACNIMEPWDAKMAGEFDLDKLEQLAHNAVSVGNVEESVALCLIDMLNSDSAAQMERANTAERVSHMHWLSMNVHVPQVNRNPHFWNRR